MVHRQILPGMRPLLAVFLACAMVRYASPVLSFVAVPPPSDADGLPAGAVVLRGAGTPAASPSTISLQSARRSPSAAAFVACAFVAIAAFSSTGGGSRAAEGKAVALQATFGTCDACPSGMAFAGATLEGPSSNSESRVKRHLLMPKNIKWKKPHKPVVKPFSTNKWKFRGMAPKGNKPHFGKYAIATMEEAWLRNTNIEAARRMIVRTLRRKGGKYWIRCFPHSAITKRTAESRMGGGKGSIDRWVMPIRPGFVMFECDGCTEEIARRAMHKITRYFPFKTKFLIKEDGPSMFELGLAGSLTKSKKYIPKEFRKEG
eukprot:TRINITY_DN2034_c0_g1_i3.p1 TRINITY_DN2034_c0_g1~~TRINITY_DN2034_c0_g1_i3.p1  ORF type:complete len:346 (-),score=73.30 TRINITY_DN2034_c0_g1_i3:111-1061(-)